VVRHTLIIDFDSTLITVESLDELARIALESRSDQASILIQLKSICTQAMAGELAFDESLRRRLRLFCASQSHVERVAIDLLSKVSPSALAIRDWLHEYRENIYVISGGFADYMVPVIELLGLDSTKLFANSFLYDSYDNIADYDPACLLSQAQGKVKQVLALELPGPTIVVGDGYADYEIKAYGAAEQFWALTETVHRPQVTAKADKVLKDFYEVQSLIDSFNMHTSGETAKKLSVQLP